MEIIQNLNCMNIKRFSGGVIEIINKTYPFQFPLSQACGRMEGLDQMTLSDGGWGEVKVMGLYKK